MSASINKFATNLYYFTNVANSSACASCRSEASRSRLVMTDGMHFRRFSIAHSCDNQRTFKAFVNLSAGSVKNCKATAVVDEVGD